MERGVEELFQRSDGGSESFFNYRPYLLGQARVHYVDRRSKMELKVDELSLVLPLVGESIELDWGEAESREIVEQSLCHDPDENAGWQSLPVEAGKAKSYAGWRRDLEESLYRSQTLEVFESSAFKIRSLPGEPEREFRIRLGDVARQARDEEVEKLRQRYARKAATLEDRIRRAQARVEKEKEQASSQKLQTAISIGSALLSIFTGRKGVSKTDLSRAGSALKGIGRSSEQSQDVERAEEDVEALAEQLDALNGELASKIDDVSERNDSESVELETVAVRPRRSDIDIRRVALLWIPWQ